MLLDKTSDFHKILGDEVYVFNFDPKLGLSCFWVDFDFRVGIDLPTIEVRYEHLSVEAEAHVGGRALPTFINFTFNIFEVCTKVKVTIHSLQSLVQRERQNQD